MEKRYFEWVKGEDIGNIVTLVSITEEDGETFFNFDDGDRCNVKYISRMTSNKLDLRGKYMVEIDSPSNPWLMTESKPKIYNDQSMQGQVVEIPSLNDILLDCGNKVSVNESVLTEPVRPQSMKPLPKISEYGEKKSRLIRNIDEVLPSANTKKKEDIFESDDFCINENDSKEEAWEIVYADNKIVGTKKIDLSRLTKEYIGGECYYTQTYNGNTIKIPCADVLVCKNESEMQEKLDELKRGNEQHEINPVNILVRASKKHLTTISMDLDVYLPSKSMFQIASSEFEGGDEKFIDLVVKSIKYETIIDALKKSLMASYSEESDS